MPQIRSDDYHDFVIKNGRFIGEFEQMYQQVADPWHCVAGADSLKNSLLLATIAQVAPSIRRGLDVGCGLGALTQRLVASFPHIEWRACDVSPTALDAARQRCPGVEMFEMDLLATERFPLADAAVDLVAMSEVMWYILPTLGRVLGDLHRVLAPGGHLFILQYFLAPEEQKYGKDIVASYGDLLRFVRDAGFTIRNEILIGATAPHDVLLWASKER